MSPEEVETQDRAMKSLTSGTATLDSFLAKAAHGFKLNNFFTISRGRNHWTSHTPLLSGGHPHLPFRTIQLFNHEGLGDLLKTETLGGPTIDSPGYKRREPGSQLPLVTAYATQKGNRVNVFVLSRRLDNFPQAGSDGFTPVKLELPFKSAKKVTLHRLVGDPRSHNLDEEMIKVETVPVEAKLTPLGDSGMTEFTLNQAAGVDNRGVPPGATLLYVFEGIE